MAASQPSTSPERAVLAVAAAQHGVVAYEQLLRSGLSPDAIRHRAQMGWLRRMHRGVYLVGPIEPPLACAMAATLAGGPGSLLSHRPAAVLWALLPGPGHAMHITVAGRNRRGRAGVQLHRVQAIHAEDAARHQAIPVTSPARTLLDLATHSTGRELARAIEEAQVLNLVTARSLDEQFARYPRHRGVAATKRAITPHARLTRSEAERRVLELIRGAGLAEPDTNVRVAGHEVDFFWPDHALSSRSTVTRSTRAGRRSSATAGATPS